MLFHLSNTYAMINSKELITNLYLLYIIFSNRAKSKAYLIKSNMASTVETSGVLPILSISSAFWDTPGLMVTTNTIPAIQKKIP